MEGFEAWHFPSGFTLREDEIASCEEEGTPSTSYASLSEPRLRELLGILRRHREKSLLSLSVEHVVRCVNGVARRLMASGGGLRGEALESLGAYAGYSRPMAEAVLDGMARGWTEENIWRLVRSEFRDPSVLESFTKGADGREVRALGFPLSLHLGAGTVPGVATTSLIRSLLVKSAVLLKPGLGDVPLPVLFARALGQEDAELANSVAVAYWPVVESGRTETALGQVDLVVAYGADRTVGWLRERLPPHVSFRAYRHRVGFGLVGRSALVELDGGEGTAWSTALDAARAVALFDQKGCVSPHVIFVEEGGEVKAEAWTRLLARAMEELEVQLPSGGIPLESGVAIQQLRGASELAEGIGNALVFHGGEAGPWTVVYDPQSVMEPSCLHRTVRVCPVESLEGALSELAPWSPHLQTVGVAGLGIRRGPVLEGLARLGVSRISAMAGVPWPEPWWHHDGSGPLQDLVRWTDVEGSVGS